MKNCYITYQIVAKLMILSTITAAILFIFNKLVYAEYKVYNGNSSTLNFDKFCDEIPSQKNITLVLEESDGKISGWFYGKGTSTAEIRQMTSSKFEVIYPITLYKNLPSSNMELLPFGGGYKVIIRDYIPEDNGIRASTCFFEKLEANLTPINESINASSMLCAKDLFLAELMLIEGFDLLYSEYEYLAAQAKGYASLKILEQIYGKLSEEALNADALVAFAFMRMERFDEALFVIEPYCKIFPNHKLLSDFLELLQNEKAEQDKLFKYDINTPSNEDLAPLG